MPACWRPTLAYALEIVDLTAGYDGLPIVRNFSARIATGTVTTLIGGNGAGKSTLMRAIYGSNRWFSGQIVFAGRAIERLPPWERLKLGIGFVPQGRCNFATLSVAENLKIACYTLPRRQHDAAIAPVLELFPFLKDKLGMLAGNMSGGEQQMLETAMVMLLKPRLLLLDEPSLGLSPRMQQDVFEMARRVADTGVTVLMVEQNVHGALRMSDTAIVLELGRKFMEGPADEVMNDPRVSQAYLGVTASEAAAAAPTEAS
ncbi:MAG: ABC transporter ATP-binding protein [Burkholderiales bacterium]|nr:ABC transporter ATP-binding protein [Burkholderiales bacterium]